ncbi:GLIPR1-like protein 1 [Etheostoma spectabile]|uniref:GLIPR1-like protein 1 n=1 Tax=Etheostoma spectabile TaxID=54343 RepID=UPI0013AF1AC7|nr:GLIPR1-like protein 1 [Etheostoma spectabile]
MGIVVKMLLWAWMVLDPGVCSVSLPDITDGNFVDECVREHNGARSSVGPPAGDMLYMTWDEGLAITARAWARRCVFEHNIYLRDVRRVHPTFSSVGENIWTGHPPSSFNVRKAVKRWVGEKQHYDYNSNGCTKLCGHYTQVVWASTYKVGCAVQLCPNGVKSFGPEEGVVFVCNYATAGNVNGRRPYEEGAGCSGCKGDCEDNLCRSKERDSQKRYNWTPDWDAAPATRGSDYVIILVVRPTALLFTFITAYAVHHFYPDVFCYE